MYICALIYGYFLWTVLHFLLSPEGNCESGTREGPLDSLSILYVIDKPNLGLQKYPTIFDFLRVSKTFIPRRELRKQYPRGSTWQSFQFICDWRTKVGSSKIPYYIRLFQSLENLYPPKGSAKARPMGSNWFSYGLSFCTSELKMEFQFCGGNSQKKFEKKPLLCGWDGRTDGRMDGRSKGSFDFAKI